MCWNNTNFERHWIFRGNAKDERVDEITDVGKTRQNSSVLQELVKDFHSTTIFYPKNMKSFGSIQNNLLFEATN